MVSTKPTKQGVVVGSIGLGDTAGIEVTPGRETWKDPSFLNTTIVFDGGIESVGTGVFDADSSLNEHVLGERVSRLEAQLSDVTARVELLARAIQETSSLDKRFEDELNALGKALQTDLSSTEPEDFDFRGAYDVLE